MRLMVPNGEIEIFRKNDVHDVYKVRMECFKSPETEMSLIAVNLFQKATSNFW